MPSVGTIMNPAPPQVLENDSIAVKIFNCQSASFELIKQATLGGRKLTRNVLYESFDTFGFISLRIFKL